MADIQDPRAEARVADMKPLPAGKGAISRAFKKPRQLGSDEATKKGMTAELKTDSKKMKQRKKTVVEKTTELRTDSKKTTELKRERDIVYIAELTNTLKKMPRIVVCYMPMLAK